MKTAIMLLLCASAGLWAGSTATTAMDGELVYKNNCNRCHITIRTYPDKMSRAIVRHMRFQAFLTKPEADAVLAYLVSNYEPATKAKPAKAGK